MCASVNSATAFVAASGAFTTATPRSFAAAVSVLSTPTPARPPALSLSARPRAALRRLRRAPHEQRVVVGDRLQQLLGRELLLVPLVARLAEGLDGGLVE